MTGRAPEARHYALAETTRSPNQYAESRAGTGTLLRAITVGLARVSAERYVLCSWRSLAPGSSGSLIMAT